MSLNDVYQKLGLDKMNDCLIRLSDENWIDRIHFPSRICRLLEKNELLKTLDAFFVLDNKPLILFFNHPGEGRIKDLHKAIWNFNESPIAIIVGDTKVDILNGFEINENSGLLKKLGGKEQLNDFSYYKLVTGKSWEKFGDKGCRTRVDYLLLNNIEAARKELIGLGLSQKVANALIGKVIFFRYLIDRRVRIHYDDKNDYWINDDLCARLSDKTEFLKFVRYVEDKETGFNGDLFHLEDSEYNSISQEALNVMRRLLSSEDISTRQQSLFNLYDFSILPIEFISNVYEKFIGKENQENEGAYYTPTFLADYIVEKTVGKHLKNNGNDCNCKVLDLSCGSGIFLVESLRRIIDKYIQVNHITDTGTGKFKEAIKSLAIDNIFGVDNDESAIQVAIFSVYLTLLDYQEPADIESFKFPDLEKMNFICSDAFNVNNKKLKRLEDRKLSFDCIIGNPPWRRGGVQKDSNCEMYLKCRNYLNILGNREIAQAFIIRTLDFAGSSTQCAQILSSKSLYNIRCKNFRSFILSRLFINQVFELAAVRREVFNKSNDPAIAPACVLFYKNANGESTDGNVIEHIALKPSRFFSMFKVFCLTSRDVQKVQQDRLKKYDWLWKVLVFGSYLDFNFINRIRKKLSVYDLISDRQHFIFGLGIQEGSNPKYNSSALIGSAFIDASAVNKFRVDERKISVFNKGRVSRIRGMKKEIFLLRCCYVENR